MKAEGMQLAQQGINRQLRQIRAAVFMQALPDVLQIGIEFGG